LIDQFVPHGNNCVDVQPPRLLPDLANVQVVIDSTSSNQIVKEVRRLQTEGPRGV
jgi:hypothetical protein